MVLQIVVGLVIIQRLTELLYSARNTRALKQDGAVEIGRGHYPLFILLHVTWLLSLLVLIGFGHDSARPLPARPLCRQPRSCRSTALVAGVAVDLLLSGPKKSKKIYLSICTRLVNT
jgi:hypothetical protein